MTLRAILAEVRRRSPRAKVAVLTYPTILPPAGSCTTLQLTDAQVATMRIVGNRLADLTRDAAQDAGATFIDMHRLGADHHACSAEPWVNGWADAVGTQFHPTLAGSKAMAMAIADTLDAPVDHPSDANH